MLCFNTGREQRRTPAISVAIRLPWVLITATSQSPDCWVLLLLLKQSKWNNPIAVIIMTDVSLSNSIYYQVRPLHGKLL